MLKAPQAATSEEQALLPRTPEALSCLTPTERQNRQGGGLPGVAAQVRLKHGKKWEPSFGDVEEEGSVSIQSSVPIQFSFLPRGKMAGEGGGQPRIC